MKNLWRCYCCGELANDLRPHSEYGVCFQCGMADARYKVSRSCTKCQGKPPIDGAKIVAHNIDARQALGRRVG